jgi:prepilin-type N-terminal cleavage/methylation domain-containing protein
MKNIFINKKRGFTLIEIIIVLAVLGLVFAFISPILSFSKKSNETINKLDIYHDCRRIDQEVFSELKLGSGILYPPKIEDGLSGDWYPQLVFRNHLNQIIMLYVNKKDKLILFNYDNVKNGYLSLGKVLGSKIKDFSVRRHGSSVVEYRLTFEINKKDFVITNKVTLVNVF